MTELRVYLKLESLRPQFAAYMGSPTRARGYVPLEGMHSLKMEDIERAGAAVLAAIGRSPADQLKPQVLYSEIVESITDAHAVILNRNREASMILPGESLLLIEMVPALFAAHAANEAERAAPQATLVDCQMIGASGRLFMSGEKAALDTARERILRALSEVEGR